MTARSQSRLTRLKFVIICVLIACASPITAQHFYFAQMTDIHFGEDDNAARAAKVVDSINHLPMKTECVVITGDIMNENILDDKMLTLGLNTLKPLKSSVYFVPGNNDILEGTQLAATQESFVKHFGPLASKAEYNGVVFLMLYTEPLRTSFQVSGFDPLKWLEQALKEAGNKPVIIFTHAPDVEDFWANEMHPGWPQQAKDKWEALIKSHNVKAVITGHFHRDELHWIGKVPQFVSAPIAAAFGRQNSYKVYEYKDGKLNYWTVYVN